MPDNLVTSFVCLYMHLKSKHNVPLWQFESLAYYREVNHFVSGRQGGVSKGALDSFNLSYKVNDVHEHVVENRRRLALAIGVEPNRLVFPTQTHSNNIKRVLANIPQDDLEDTDALITNVPALCIAVMSADCVPVLLYDPVQKAVAAIHAGWRGTVGKILTATVQAMQAQFNTNPANLLVGIGPSICPEVYEVGSEVLHAAQASFGTLAGLARPASESGKGYFNLWEANRIQLLALGVKQENIEVAGICTYTEHDAFFSARHSGNSAGRFAAGIVLNS
jgi:polyphenol oxidase